MHGTLRFQTSNHMNPGTPARSRRSRNVLWLATAFVFFFTTAFAYAKDYTRIVVFGDSLSDTGNMAHLFQHKYGFDMPGPVADYTNGRFTSGFDTVPAAQKYFGVWVEQFAQSMPSRPKVVNSLDGGTNYAYGFACVGNGTGTFNITDADSPSVEVDNMGQQITSYLATKPKINNSTLFIIWGGANDIIHAKSGLDIVGYAMQETLDIQRLIEAGATQFLVVNLPPLGLIPRLNFSSETMEAGNGAAMLFNSYLATGLSVLHDFYPNRHIAVYQLDVFTLFTQIAAAPSDFGLTNFTAPAQGNFAVNPDTYLFWDDLHPTARAHAILADAAISLVASPQCDLLGEPSCAARAH